MTSTAEWSSVVLEVERHREGLPVLSYGLSMLRSVRREYRVLEYDNLRTNPRTTRVAIVHYEFDLRFSVVRRLPNNVRPQ